MPTLRRSIEASARTIAVPVTLSTAEASRLADIFDVDLADSDDPVDSLASILVGLGAAALREYIQALTGLRNPSTIRELRELRLLLLYEHMSGAGPSDRQVRQLFQLTPTQANNLIAGSRARFEDRYAHRLREVAADAVRHARQVDDTWRLVIADSLARYVSELIAQTEAPPMRKRRDAGRTYELSEDTIRPLCDLLGVRAADVDGLD